MNTQMRLLTVTIFFISSAFSLAFYIQVNDLRCEYQVNPYGIDVNQPRLGWKIKAVDLNARGQEQTAYQILVASSEHLLSQHIGDLWDSDKVYSSESIHVYYSGKTLDSAREYYWKIRR